MNRGGSRSSIIEVFVKSISFHGDMSSNSDYNVSYMVPSISFKMKNYYPMLKVIHCDEGSQFAISNVYPNEFDLYLVFKNKFSTHVSEPFHFSIESPHFNMFIAVSKDIKDKIFTSKVFVVVTCYIMTKFNNPVKLHGFNSYNVERPQFISDNIYSVDEEKIAKRIDIKTINNPKSESMREILPFYEIPEHNCIIKLKGYSYIRNDFYLILERYGESLDEHIKRRDLSNKNILKIIVCVCCGLIHMHQHNYIHRDIKPGNIVVNASGDAKLIDFGISREFHSKNLTSEIGTYKYIAPEVNDGEYDFRCDIYSLGVVILEMISNVSVDEFMKGQELTNIPTITQIILRLILSPDPRKRPTLDEILFMILLGNFNLIRDICGYDIELFNSKSKKRKAKIERIMIESYKNIISPIRNDFNRLLMKDDGFIYHYGYYLHIIMDFEKASDILHLGYLLGNEHCNYMIELLSGNECAIAHNVETMNVDLVKLFMSLPLYDSQTLALKSPNDLQKNIHVINQMIHSENSLIHDIFIYGTQQDLLTKDLFDSYVFLYKGEQNETETEIDCDIINHDLQILLNNIKDGVILLVDCYHLIVLLSIMRVDKKYLFYLAHITQNDEFIGNIIYMFGNIEDYDRAIYHLMKSKSSLSLDIISRIYEGVYQNQYLVDKLSFIMAINVHSILFNLTSEKSTKLRNYYAWVHYLRTQDVGHLKQVINSIECTYRNKVRSIIKSVENDPIDREIDEFHQNMRAGEFQRAKDIVKNLVQKSEVQNYLLIYLAFIKFGEGDIVNGLINLNWAPKYNSFVNLIIGHFYLHGYRLPKNIELGLQFVQAAAADYSQAKIDLAFIYLQGIYVKQNSTLALKYLFEVYNEYKYVHVESYIDNVRNGNYYFYPKVDLYFNSLMLELQLCEDYVPNREDDFYFGIFQQDDSFYLKHAQLQNPLAMFCYAHCVPSADEAISWLEKSAKYELGISYHELAYLYAAYKYDIGKSNHYSNFCYKIGLNELITRMYMKDYIDIDEQTDYRMEEFSNSFNTLSFLYPYRFEKSRIGGESYLQARAEITAEAIKKVYGIENFENLGSFLILH